MLKYSGTQKAVNYLFFSNENFKKLKLKEGMFENEPTPIVRFLVYLFGGSSYSCLVHPFIKKMLFYIHKITSTISPIISLSLLISVSM